MKATSHIGLIAGAVLLTLTVSPRAHAAAIMDQIGTSGAFFTGDNAETSENFSDFTTYDISMVDDFSISGATIITNASAAMLGFNGFTSFSGLTGFDVNIYSSAAAANTSLTGDVYHATIPESLATITAPFSGDALSGLVSLPVTVALTTAGTYYVSILADGSFSGDGEVGVYGTTGLSGSNPGNVNAFQENPGGAFGFGGEPSPLGVDAAYRLTGVSVHEPGTWAMMLGGFGALAGVRFLRRRRAA
jgi:hypothetical protein